MFEELDRVTESKETLIDNIERCLYGDCVKCPFHGKGNCTKEVLFQMETYLKKQLI